MHKFLLMPILSLFIVFMGCQKERGVIPRKDMIAVLVDIHLMDEAMQRAKYDKDIALADTLDAYRVVLKGHGYTRAQFDSSLRYYSKDLRKFDRIYQEVLARLNKMEIQDREAKEQAKSKPDTKGSSGKSTQGKDVGKQ